MHIGRNGGASSPVAGWVWYRGGAYRGFQRQQKAPTVQDVLIQALAPLGVSGVPNPAGRTDRGVHARMQVVSFRLPLELEPEEALRSWRARLPPDVGVLALRRASRRFHAQWQARGKEYRYRLALGAPAEAWKPFVWQPHLEPRLASLPRADPEQVEELLSRCVGTRDFFAFHESSSVRRPRTLQSASLQELSPGMFEIRLRGDSFARYQVRYLVGSVLATAMGALSREQMLGALESAQTIPGVKAPASGLVLWEVHYPEEVDPFPPDERLAAPGLPQAPPFVG